MRCSIVFAFAFALASVSAVEGTTARAEPPPPPVRVASTFALDLSGVRFGFVRALQDRRLVLTTADVAPAYATLLDAFVQKKTVKRDVRLTSGAVVKKANDARLVAVKLPALGSGGGPAELEVAFEAPPLSTQPLLTAKESPPPPASARIADFRIDIAGMQAFEAPKLDAIAIAPASDGSLTAGEIAIETAAGGAPPFLALQKTLAPRVVRIEYVAADGKTLLSLRLDRCVPTSVKPLGASGTTRVTMTCAPLG